MARPSRALTDANDFHRILGCRARCWETYTFNFVTSSPNCRLLLFRNPSNSPYWGEPSITSAGNECAEHHLLRTGDRRVWDRGRERQRIARELQLSSQELSRAGALTSGTVYSHRPAPDGPSSVRKPNSFELLVGRRGAANKRGLGHHHGARRGGARIRAATRLSLPARTLTHGVDFIIGDFNVNPRGTFYVNAYPYYPGRRSKHPSNGTTAVIK
jgi:hypothetical protein